MPMKTASTTFNAIDTTETSIATATSSAIVARRGKSRFINRLTLCLVHGSMCWTATTMMTPDSATRGI